MTKDEEMDIIKKWATRQSVKHLEFMLNHWTSEDPFRTIRRTFVSTQIEIVKRELAERALLDE